MAEEVVGTFHYLHNEQGRISALTEWRLVTADRRTARAVGRLLGGVPAPVAHDLDGWEVRTHSAVLLIDIEGTSPTLRFHLSGATDSLGLLAFAYAPWSLGEITSATTRPGVGGWGPATLSIRKVDVTTRTGVFVRHLMPVLGGVTEIK
jgi:hypothetical protein